MLPSGKLRFRNAHTFEDESSGKQDRPLEWRRSFNTVSYIGKSPSIERLYSVNEIEYIDEPPDSENSPDLDKQAIVATPKPIKNLRVGFHVSQDELRDVIYCTEETEGRSDIYTLSRPRGDVRIFLTDKPPTDGRGPFGSGAYTGLAFRTDYESDESYLCIDVSVPSTHLEEIASELQRNPSLEMHVQIAIQSFSYEVDDALREWYHPRDLFIHRDAAPAAVVSVRTAKSAPQVAETTLEDDELSLDVAESPLDYSLNIPVPQLPSNVEAKQLSGIKVALWAIAALLAINLAK